MRQIQRHCGVILICVLAVSAAWGADRTTKVAVALRFDDVYNTTAERLFHGIEVAREVFQRKNPDRRIEIVKFNHGRGLDSVAATANQIIKEGNVAVIGGELSEEAIILSDLLNEAHVVFVTPTSSNPTVTTDKPFAFRMCFSDEQVAERLADFTLNELKPTAIGAIHNISSPYTDYLSSHYLEALRKNGQAKNLPKVFEYKVLRDTANFETQIRDMKNNHVSHVAMLTHETDLLRFTAQAERQSFFPIYIGSDGWGLNENVYRKLVTESKTGEMFHAYRNVYWKDDSSSPITSVLRNEFKKKFNKEPDAWNAIGFDTAYVLFNAIKHAEMPINGESIQRAMLKLSGLSLVTNDDFNFGPKNQPSSGVVIYEIAKAGIRYKTTLR